MGDVVFTKTFTGKGTFDALAACENWLTVRGFSFGPNERDHPTGVMFGEISISKWRNLDADERAELHGVIAAGDHRNGPVTVEIFGNAPTAALVAAGVTP